MADSLIYGPQGFDQWGYYPPHPCKGCGNMLRGQDSGYPAELYAGTYNGLCYPCTHKSAYLVGVTRDGAEVWNYPPSYDSNRRTREDHFGYPDCPHCHGKGVNPFPRGSYCVPCIHRYSAEPRRAQFHTRCRRVWDAAQNRYNRQIAAYRKTHKLKKKDPIPVEVQNQLGEPIRVQYQRISAKLITHHYAGDRAKF